MAFQRKITISGCPSCLSGEAGKFDFVISVEDVGKRLNRPNGVKTPERSEHAQGVLSARRGVFAAGLEFHTPAKEVRREKPGLRPTGVLFANFLATVWIRIGGCKSDVLRCVAHDTVLAL